jgi:tetratricopeptide (TPR) repeat protein
MADNFISSVASNLAANLISSMIETLGGPPTERIQELMFQKRLMTRVVRKICTGYEELESAERAEGELFAIDEGFFRDPVVRTAFTERIVVGDVDRGQLRNRFVALYGERQVDLFDRNLDDALAIFETELSAALNPAERAAFADLKRDLGSLRESTQAILTSQARTEQLVTQYGDQILEGISSRPTEADLDVELSSEYQAQLDQARNLLRVFQPKLALEHLHALKDRIWDKASSNDKFRLLTYMGFAHLQLNEEPEAAQMFIDAWGFNRDGANALCNASLGFLLQGESKRCEELARQALEKDPTVEQAYSMLVYSSSEDEPLELTLEKVPEVHRNTVEVAMALGKLALQRSLLTEAEHWFRVAVKNDTQGHPDPRGMLADSLLTKLTADHSVHPMPGLVNPMASLAVEAIELYDYAWGRVSKTDLRSLRLNWLVNRATAKTFLNNTEGAVRDIDEALDDSPENTGIINNRAMLAYRSGDLPRATTLFRQIVDAEETPDVRFWLALVLYEDGRLSEANALVQEFLERPDLTPPARRDGIYVLVSIRLLYGDLAKAREQASLLREDLPDDPGVLALCARVARYEGYSEEVESLLAEAQTKITPATRLVTRYRLVDELYENGEFEAAANLVEEMVDTQIDGRPTRQLLTCYYRSGNLGPALEICRTLREKHGPVRFVTEMESAIYEEIDDLPAARRVCQEYLASFPDDLWVRLRLAAVNFRLKEFEDLDRFLGQDLDITEFAFEGYAQLAELHLARGRVRQALAIAYEARRQFFNKPEAHLAYVHTFIRRGSEQDDWLDAQQVDIDTAVRIDSSMGDKQPWIIIEDRDDVDIGRGELPPSHLLVRELLTKRTGDSISLSHGVYTKEITIREIRSKFVHAFNESLEAYQFRFPDVPGIWKGQVRVPADDRGPVEGLQPIFDMIDRRYEYIYEAEQFYRQRQFPIGSLADVLGKNPIEVHAALMAEPDVGVRCCSGRTDEREEAVALTDSNCKLIVDIISLMTLNQLGIGDAIVGACGTLGVVRSTLELVDRLLSNQSIHTGEYWTLGKEGGLYVRTLVTVEQIEHNRQVLESVLTWAEANCDILPCTAALTVKRDARAKLGELIGPSFVETVLVATDEDRVLYSDDGPLRELAKVEYGVSGVWTQTVLMSLHKRGHISDDKYAQCVVKLACSNYRHTSINSQVVLEASKQTQWRPVYPFTQVVEILGGANSDLDSAVRVAVKYIYLLWSERILPDQYERLIMTVLNALTSHRKNRRGVLNAFARAIEIKFKLAPTETHRIQEIVKAWTAAHLL